MLRDGLDRRNLLRLGGLGLLGTGLAGVRAAPPAGPFGKAKACILIHLFGAPPQHETFDPKPDAPAEIQGELKAIATSVPGVRIGEGLPRLARIADRLCFVRSLTHAWPFHGVHYSLSGIPSISPTVEAEPSDRTLWPSIGSVVDHLDEQRAGPTTPPVPRNLALPFRLYSRANFRPLGGPYAGFLGGRHDPVWAGFTAAGTKAVPNPTAKADVLDPFGGILPTDRFTLAGEATPAGGLAPDRVGPRRSLLARLEHGRRGLNAHEAVRGYDRSRDVAHALLTSPALSRAPDVQHEPRPTRERYGMTLFGQSLLAARRLVEAGGRFVTVFWDAYDDATAGWDTHFYHYPRLKSFLLPGLDESLSALVLDLEARGLLDETLVICTSEHGRTPKITNTRGGGREHWSRAYGSVLAGGGVARGNVVGRTDSAAGEVRDTPVSPKDVLATAFYLLGIDPHTTVRDRFDRPVPVAGEGVVRREVFA